MKLRRSYAIKEGGEQDFAISTTKLTGSTELGADPPRQASFGSGQGIGD